MGSNLQENNKLKVQIALLVIGILLIILPITVLQLLRLQIIYQIQLLPRFLQASPFLGLTICFLSWRKIVKIENISRKIMYAGELYVFIMAFLIGLGLVEYYWSIGFIVSQMVFYTTLLFTSSFVRIRNKTLLLILLTSSVFSIVVSYFAYPFYDSTRGETMFFLLFMPDIRISFFYVLIIVTTVLGLLFSFSLMCYLDAMMVELLGKQTISLSPLKSVAVHLQLIPILLSPLAILQTFGKTEFLEPAVLVLFTLCYAKLIAIILGPLLAIIGKHIGSIKSLGITSLWSLLSFIQTAFVVFNFIILNIDAGSYAFTLIVASLFATALGFASSRVEQQRKTVINV